MLELSENKDRIRELSENIKHMALPEATERIAGEAAKILQSS